MGKVFECKERTRAITHARGRIVFVPNREGFLEFDTANTSQVQQAHLASAAEAEEIITRSGAFKTGAIWEKQGRLTQKLTDARDSVRKSLEQFDEAQLRQVLVDHGRDVPVKATSAELVELAYRAMLGIKDTAKETERAETGKRKARE